MTRAFIVILMVLSATTSCVPILISRSIKEEKQRKMDAENILNSKNLIHLFVQGSQSKESIIINGSNEELIFIHEREIFQCGEMYSASKIDENSRRITYFEIVFVAQNKRIEVERFSVWAVIQLLHQNLVFEAGALNEEAIDRLVVKYRSNRFSSLIGNKPHMNIQEHE